MAEVSGAACFGKLPFHREYLRFGLDRPGASDVVRWVEGAHERLSRTRPDDAVREVWTRFAVTHGDRVVLTSIRPSTDGLRRHPVAVCASMPSVPDGTWPFVPGACAPVWDAIESAVDSARSVDDLATGLMAVRVTVDAEAGSGGPLEAPSWGTLVGGDADDALHAATNLAAVAEAQRAATSPLEGVAIIVPIPPGAGSAGPWSAAWIELVRVAVGAAAGRPTLALLPDPRRLVIAFRPLDPDDVAAVLSGRAAETMDDLLERWQKVPHAEESRRAEAERLMACVAEVWRSLGFPGSS